MSDPNDKLSKDYFPDEKRIAERKEKIQQLEEGFEALQALQAKQARDSCLFFVLVALLLFSFGMMFCA